MTNWLISTWRDAQYQCPSKKCILKSQWKLRWSKKSSFKWQYLSRDLHNMKKVNTLQFGNREFYLEGPQKLWDRYKYDMFKVQKERRCGLSGVNRKKGRDKS